MIDKISFWPNDARLAISISLMYEGGGQPISGAPGVIPERIKNGLPDMATNGVFQYGIYECTPRLLNLMDKHNIKLTVFMIGQGSTSTPSSPRRLCAVATRPPPMAAHGQRATIAHVGLHLAHTVRRGPAARSYSRQIRRPFARWHAL